MRLTQQSRAEQSRAEQSRAEQSRAEQSRAEQSRAEQSRAEQSRAEQSRAEQSRAEQSRAEQSRAEQSRAEQNCTRPLTEEQEKNLVICTSGGGQKAAFSVLMSSVLPSLHMVDIDGSQCFPMFLYETEDGQ
ncbi:type ISP restriction/modification enzyme [Nguyenibacter sp. L1]|uniref:type ISP restriction/modification enzyme n=1 Tax=Nguyenibacter sp. L1 TaxID=3049350 RepID=UPI0038D05525